MALETLKFGPQFVASGNGAIAETFRPSMPVIITEIRIHLSAASSTVEDLTIDLDSHVAAAGDVRFFTQAMNTVQDIWINETDLSIYLSSTGGVGSGENDGLVFTFANSNSRTWSIAIQWKMI